MNTTKTANVVLGLAAVLASGCNKKSADGEAGAGGGGSRPAAFAAWMPANASAAWQGAWASRMTLQASDKDYSSMAGDPIALEITGDKATAFDGKREHELGFVIDSPCSVRFSEPLTEGGMKGGTAFHDMLFVLDGDKVLIENGSVGLRKGKAAIVCHSMQNVTHVLDDKGTCTAHELGFDKEWEATPATCTWSTKDGKDVLTIAGDRTTTLIANGDRLEAEDFGRWVKYHQRATDYAAAKAAVIAELKATDPGEQAKAAGGKVGETGTVASLQATYGADRSWKGKPVEVTGLYLNANSSSGGGAARYNAILVESEAHRKITLTCHTAAEVTGFTQYEKVTARGTVDESFGRAELRDCTLAKAE